MGRQYNAAAFVCFCTLARSPRKDMDTETMQREILPYVQVDRPHHCSDSGTGPCRTAFMGHYRFAGIPPGLDLDEHLKSTFQSHYVTLAVVYCCRNCSGLSDPFRHPLQSITRNHGYLLRIAGSYLRLPDFLYSRTPRPVLAIGPGTCRIHCDSTHSVSHALVSGLAGPMSGRSRLTPGASTLRRGRSPDEKSQSDDRSVQGIQEGSYPGSNPWN